MAWKQKVASAALAASFTFVSGTIMAQGPASGQSGQSAQSSGQGERAHADEAMRPGSENTAKFFKKAAKANLAEVELARLGAQKANDPEVKQFAEKMVDAHTKAHNELKQVAADSNVQVDLPTALDDKQQKVHNKLSGLDGEEFDREFMEAMIKAHQSMEDLLAEQVGDRDAREPDAAAGTTGTTGTSGTPVGTTTGQTTVGGSPTTGSATGTSGTAGAGTMTGEAGTAGAVMAGASVDQSRLLSGAAYEWAAKTLQDVRQHLEEAKELEDRVKDDDR